METAKFFFNGRSQAVRLALGICLVSNNTHEFERVAGLTLENWAI